MSGRNLLGKSVSKLKMTVIMKRDHRRKHHSHEWFLTAFAPVYTTRLRASSTSRTTGVSISFAGSCAQGFEYEASIPVFNGAFHWTGMLPVLPGPCVQLDIMLREGDAVQIALDVEQERVRGQLGKLRAIHQAASKALLALHSNVWSSLTVTKQMHRATWATYTRRQQQSFRSSSSDSSTMLEPFTPYEKASAAFEYVELKTQLTNELQRQLLLIIVLLRLDSASVCLHTLPQMLSSESLYWTRMQAVLVPSWFGKRSRIHLIKTRAKRKLSA